MFTLSDFYFTVKYGISSEKTTWTQVSYFNITIFPVGRELMKTFYRIPVQRFFRSCLRIV